MSHWLALSSKAASFTIVMQCSTGHTASHTPQPQQASMAASNVPSGITSKTESGHEIQQRLHFTQVSKSITGRIVRVVNFLKYGLRSGTYPCPPSFGLPMGMAGIVTPSRISHHFGISNEYGISLLPSVILTSRVSRRSKAFLAEATLRSDPHSISWIAWLTPSSVRKFGAILARAPRMRASVWSSLCTHSPEKLAL